MNILIKIYQLLLFVYKYKRHSLNIFFKIKKFNVKYLDNFSFGSENINNHIKKKILNSKLYFEYGSGATTLYAINKNKKFISIESDLKFIRVFKNHKSVKFFNIGFTGKFSYPIFLNKKKFIAYVCSFDKLVKKKFFPDFILIDGRFRVAAALNLLKYYDDIKKNRTCIMIDDFKKRKYYNILKQFYYVEPKGRLAYLKPKNKLFPKKIFYEKIIDPR